MTCLQHQKKGWRHENLKNLIGSVVEPWWFIAVPVPVQLWKSFGSGSGSFSGSSSGSRLILPNFSTTKIVTKSCFFNARNSISQKAGLKIFIFDFCITFYAGPGRNPVPVPLKQKFAFPAVPVSQQREAEWVSSSCELTCPLFHILQKFSSTQNFMNYLLQTSMVSMQNITLISLYGRRETKKEMIGPVLARPGCQSSNLVLNPEPHKLNDE